MEQSICWFRTDQTLRFSWNSTSFFRHKALNVYIWNLVQAQFLDWRLSAYYHNFHLFSSAWVLFDWNTSVKYIFACWSWLKYIFTCWSWAMSGYLGAASKVSSDSPLVFPNHLYGSLFVCTLPRWPLDGDDDSKAMKMTLTMVDTSE